ncbi:MAG TPA: hypothetical protein VLN48_05635 [Bryobacteraceae bacterium]|nr:hypothetical protein [Bryobacteraceae bacterium]
MAADKDKGHFVPGPASSYPGHQTQEGITIAAVPYVTEEQAKSAFGKVNPYERGILPVLVIVENGSGQALRLDLTVQFVDRQNHHLDAIPPEDVLTYQAIKKPPRIGPTTPLPIPVPKSKKKGPLNTPEIVNRALSVKLIPPGEKAYGFFYFQATYDPGAKLYLNGLSNATNGKEYFYFDVPLETK